MFSFSDEQNEVINLRSGWHACLAPAGSGKTEILTERVSQALESGVNPSRMICLTFTNRAAREMKKRIKKRIDDRAEEVFIGNTHAYALKMLSVNKLLSGSDALLDEKTESMLWCRSVDYSVLSLLEDSPEEIEMILRAEIAKLGLVGFDLNAGALSSSKIEIVSKKIRIKSPFQWDLRKICSLIQPLIEAPEIVDDVLLKSIEERLLSFSKDMQGQELAIAIGLALVAYSNYTSEKKALGLYDYDDLLVKSWMALMANSDLKMSGYTWCQIDEVQDLSPLQWQIVKKLLGEAPHVLLLGDIRQSIYRFLGASVEVTQHHLGMTGFRLTRNYRSPANLVAMADAYCQVHFNEIQKTKSVKPAKDNALIYVHRRTRGEVLTKLLGHVEKLVRHSEEPTIAILCPTNAQVNSLSILLSHIGLDHFKINSQDLFSSELALDFMAFINVLYEPKNRLAWSRLLWRFSNVNPGGGQTQSGGGSRVTAMQIAAELGRLGCELHDFLIGDSCFDYLLRRFHNDAGESVTYFDTETTGLDFDNDAIIQIAGVRVKDGIVSDEIDLYCQTDRPLGESVNIHNITHEILSSRGLPIHDQIKRFLEFSESDVLIAHNLPFDDAMLNSHINKWAPELYSLYSHRSSYCTLDIARRLFPDLPKHKLGFLLEHFNLEGVNSHNALDDVRAGANLLKLLVKDSGTRLDAIDQAIHTHFKVISRFRENFLPIWKEAQALLNSDTDVSLSVLLDLLFSNYGYLSLVNHGEQNILDFRRKLERHAESLSESSEPQFKTAPLKQFLSDCVPFYQTAKESDLITRKDKLVISTIHRSKGLEFDVVILPDMVDGTIPGFWITRDLEDHSSKIRLEAERQMEEQKRLLYVALTRAKSQLVIGAYEYDVNQMHKKGITPFLSPILDRFTPY